MRSCFTTELRMRTVCKAWEILTIILSVVENGTLVVNMFDRTTHVECRVVTSVTFYPELDSSVVGPPSRRLKKCKEFILNLPIWYQTEDIGGFMVHFRWELFLNFITNEGTTACLYGFFFNISSSTAFYVNEKEHSAHFQFLHYKFIYRLSWKPRNSCWFSNEYCTSPKGAEAEGRVVSRIQPST